MSYGDRPKCIYSLKLDRRIISSDGSESWSDSEITFSNLFIGEVHDPTAERRSGQVKVLDAPASELCPQYGQHRPADTLITPKLLHRQDERDIYDAGENISGFVRVRTRAGFTGELVLRFAENLNPDGSLNFSSSGGTAATPTGVYR